MCFKLDAQRQGRARRGDRGAAARRHAAAAELPADEHGALLLAARPRDLSRRRDAAGRAQPGPPRGDRRPRAGRGDLRARPAAIRTAPRSPSDGKPGSSPTRPTAPSRVIDLAAGERASGDHGRPAPLASRGDRDRPEAAARLRRRHPPGPDRGDQHEPARGRAHPLGRAPAGDRHRARPGQRHRRRLPAALGELGRGRRRRLRALGEAKLRPRGGEEGPARTPALADRILDHETRDAVEHAERTRPRSGRALRRGGGGGGRGGGRGEPGRAKSKAGR